LCVLSLYFLAKYTFIEKYSGIFLHTGFNTLFNMKLNDKIINLYFTQIKRHDTPSKMENMNMKEQRMQNRR
jgi:Ulp1 family protease